MIVYIHIVRMEGGMEKSVGYEEFKLAEDVLAKNKVSLPGRRFPLRYLQV